MAKKIIQEENFEVDRNAFSGPFKCHGKNTLIVNKEIDVNGNIFRYSVWLCQKCRKEYLDTEQAKKLENIWIIEKLLKDDVLTMKRSINFDGKMFFLRFPIELTKKWKKGNYADIKPIDNNRFIVEIKC